MKVAIMEGLGISESELAARKAPFEAEGVVFSDFARTGDVSVLIEEARDADVMILANMPMPAAVLRACPRLKFVDVAFTGVDHVGLDAARERGIAVSNASGYSNEAVAELVLGTVLSMARNLRAVEDRCRAGGTKDGLVGWELKGKTVGIVGLGKIGTRTAELFHAFGAKLLAHSRTVHAAEQARRGKDGHRRRDRERDREAEQLVFVFGHGLVVVMLWSVSVWLPGAVAPACVLSMVKLLLW